MGVRAVGLAEDAQKAAQRQQRQRERAATATIEKARAQHLEWVCTRTGMDAEYAGDRDLAVGEYHGDTPVCVTRAYPCYTLDNVLVAFDPRAREVYLVCTSVSEGDYIGPRVLVPAGSKYTKAQRKRTLVTELGKAMSTAAAHPLIVLREADEGCPTCGRKW